MGFAFTDRPSSLLCLLQLVSLLQAVSSAGASCETVFKGFSDCLLSFGENMVSYREDPDDLENLRTVCSPKDKDLIKLTENQGKIPKKQTSAPFISPSAPNNFPVATDSYRYWNDFLSCTSAVVADCQDEALELWEKLKVPSGSVNYRGSLFQLCSEDSGSPGPDFTLELTVWTMTLSKLVMWVVLE